MEIVNHCHKPNAEANKIFNTLLNIKSYEAPIQLPRIRYAVDMYRRSIRNFLLKKFR